MIRYPIFAAAFVFAASAAGSGDYVLRLPGEPPICAKSAATCEAAREAIAKGWLPTWAPPDAVTLCEPAPGCFDESANCIPGYNCK